jgi:hypothetical protein
MSKYLPSLPVSPDSADSGEELARCYRCEEMLPVGSFAGDRSKASGRKSICRECDRKRARDADELSQADVPQYMRRRSRWNRR